MTFTYSELIENPSSEKGLLAHIEPAQRILEWTNHAGNVWKKVVPFYVIRIKQDTTEAIKVTTLASVNAAGKFFFEGSTKTLYYWANGNIDPSLDLTIAFYRIGFSSFPFIGPIDDTDEKEIEYYPIIKGTSRFSHKLDHVDQVGISLSSSSKLTFILEDFFLENYDLLYWENKRCRVYSHFPQLAYSEKRIYFDGRVEDKSISGNDIGLTIKDFLDVLKENVESEVFTEADGELAATYLGNAKRRVYGRVTGLRAISLNQTLIGFNASGTFTAEVGGTTVTGVASSLLNELSFEDEVLFGEDKYKVQDITSDTSFTVSEVIDVPIISASMIITPIVESIRTGRNTDFLISGHALKQASSTITEVIQRNRFRLANAQDFTAGDFVAIGSFTREIRRVSTDNVITTTQTLTVDPAIGAIVSKNPVQRVFGNGLEYIIDRDYTVSNLTTGCKLIMNPLAEFNISTELNLGGNATFINGSRTVVFTGIEVATNFKARDWVRPNSVSLQVWYEILKIDQALNTITLRVPFVGAYAGETKHKSISGIGDDTIITVECFGATDDGTPSGIHLKTASQIVQNLMEQSGVINELNQGSFELANEMAPQLMSLAIPFEFNSKMPQLQEVFEKINKTVFGSLHYNTNFEIEYNILSPDKPDTLPSEVITDSDIISWSVNSTSKNIVKNLIASYKHQDADRFTGEKSASVIEYTNDIVNKIIESTAFEEMDIYLWHTQDAETMIQRKSYINEVSQSIIVIKAPIKYASKSINDKLLVKFDRLFGRFGSQLDGLDKRKICIISGVDKDDSSVTIEADDLGNIWNRTANVAANSSLDFSLAGDERIMNGYITDSDELIDNLQATYRLNLIG